MAISSHFPNVIHVFLGKFMATVSFTLRRSLGFFFALRLSSFSHLVGHVVSACSKENMFRVTAQSSIAMVQAAKSFWNFTNQQFVRQPMRQHYFTHEIKLSVAGVHGCSSINPATVFPLRFINFIPKPRFRRFVSLWVGGHNENTPTSERVVGNDGSRIRQSVWKEVLTSSCFLSIGSTKPWTDSIIARLKLQDIYGY